MKKLLFILLCFGLFACNSNSKQSTEKKQIKPSDIAGLYNVKMQLDTTNMGEDAGMAMGFMAMMEISMEIGADGSIIYKAGMGAMANEENFTYSIKGDSITLNKPDGGESYLIKKESNGLKFSSEKVNLILTKK